MHVSFLDLERGCWSMERDQGEHLCFPAPSAMASTSSARLWEGHPEPDFYAPSPTIAGNYSPFLDGLVHLFMNCVPSLKNDCGMSAMSLILSAMLRSAQKGGKASKMVTEEGGGRSR